MTAEQLTYTPPGEYECRWCSKRATAWIRDVEQGPPGYAVCDWHADQSKRLGWRVFRPEHTP